MARSAAVFDSERDDVRDGRRSRSLRSRAAIAAAFVKLIDGGNLSPSSHEVAAEAGVGHRTVFRHFQDMDALYVHILTEIGHRIESLRTPIAPTGPLRTRIERVVAQRARFHERIKMFRRALMARYWSSQTLRRLHRREQRTMHESLRQALPECERLSPALVTSVDVLLSFESWWRLREVQGLSVTNTQRTLTEALCEILLPCRHYAASDPE